MGDIITFGFSGNPAMIATLGFASSIAPIVVTPITIYPDPYHATWIDDNHADPCQAVVLD